MKRPATFQMRKFFALSFMLITAACTSTSQTGGPDATVSDPLEPMNRAVFAFNKAADTAVITPLAKAYTTVVPKAPRQGVSNLMRNLREPWVFVNDILQFKFKRAGTTLGRFLVNTVAGVGGLFKVSEKMGIKYHSEDFGQTLATWGLGDGPYIVLPFLGPSNLRDTAGLTTYIFLDPTTKALKEIDQSGNFFDLALIRTGIDAWDTRVQYDEVLRELYLEDDPYVFARTVYWQTRRYEIHDGNPPSTQEEEDLFDDLEEEEQ
ncbi:MAG: VacJ family lipoprotein [Alphaproteobacteria bacterium]|nr:VacJ family lipoprotein [Alphaproteobacteria bacterium]